MKLTTCLILLGLATCAFSATSKTIPELYKFNNGYFTSDYSVTYNNPVKSGEFGVSSEAGDINNDGIPDFIIGNPANDNNKGIAYVIYGRKGSLRQFNSMDDFQSSDGFIIRGNMNGQKLGFSVSALGDVNGDGIDDFIIGSPFWGKDGMGTEAGVAYVIFGRRSSAEFQSVVDVDRLSSTQGFKVFGESGYGRSGYSVSGAGDVNGDGISDILLGAFGISRAYVIYGSKQGLTDMVLPPALGKGFAIQGPRPGDFGSSVSNIGDFNGDGVDDIIVGAHVAGDWAGKAYIIYGRREGFQALIQATEGMTLEGMFGGDNFGCIVSGAGDFNGDGLKDVIIGAYGANGGRGGAYVILGSRQNPTVLNMKATDTASSRGFNVMSSYFSQMGLAAAGGRDLNGDGLSDIIIGAPAWNKENGAVYIIYGSRSIVNFWLDNGLQSTQGYAMYGTQEGSRYGQFVRVLKDINNDGVNDFIVGAFTANGGKGAANLFYLPWKCMSTCSQCSKPDKCDVCAPGLGFLNGDCVSCPSGAYTLVNGVCVRCSANCAWCSRTNTCDTCASGYGFLDNNCVTCPWATHTLINGVCQMKCSGNCSQCSQPNTCDKCLPGFGFLGNNCTICPSGTHVLKDGFCVKCSANCAKCSQPNSCDVCSPGFGFLNNECTICPSSTHVLKGGYCEVKCSANCAQCSKPNTCDKCASGFGLLGNDCVICPADYYVLKEGVCQPKCSANCAQCSKPYTCDKCASGFGFLGNDCITCPEYTHALRDGVCERGPKNCAKWSKPDVCEFCMPGYGFLGNDCAPCPENTHFLNNGYCIEVQDPWKVIKDFFSGLF